MTYRILFVDDDETGRELGCYNLAQQGYAVDQAPDGRRGLDLFSTRHHDLIITDLRMPKLTGLELLKHVKGASPDVPVVVVTAHGKVETAVKAMKLGAYDFIEKPYTRDLLLLVVRRALERVDLLRQNRELRVRAHSIERPIIAQSAAMQDLLKVADRVAEGDMSVLISGESGTGKELVARRIHARSGRRDQPFVAVNCAAIPGDLLEAELFGHEKGAFTGAVSGRAGRFRSAEGGTILLDEVSEIQLALQAKLLRVLQEKVVDVLGADEPVPIDVRVVASTNRDLASCVAAGQFRQDLFYRLNAFELHIPPLRNRIEDIPALVDHFVRRAAAGRELTTPDAVMGALCRRAWAGNVRELQNICERLVLLCEGDALRLEDLPASPAPPSTDEASAKEQAWPTLPAEGLSLIDLERQVIEEALRIKGGNITQAATFLHVPRHILVYRIAKFGISRAS